MSLAKRKRNRRKAMNLNQTLGAGSNLRYKPYYTVLCGGFTRGAFETAAAARAFARKTHGPIGWKIKRITGATHGIYHGRH